MRLTTLATVVTLAATPALADFVSKPSDMSVAETMDALEAAVTTAGATVFARVDHSAGAASVDLELADSQLLIFGNPMLGTPAMQDDPRAGLALPLRVLVYDDGGQTVVYYEDVAGMFDGLSTNADAEYAARMAGALDMLTGKAVGN